MAIIYSYPQKTTPAGNDFLVITDSEQPAPNKNRTKSLTVDNLANYVVTSTSGITGSGTLNTIAMFTPDGQSIGDSVITQAPLGQAITVNTGLDVVEDLNVTGTIETSSNLLVNGTTTLYGPLEVNSTYYDAAGDEGTDGDVLVAKGTPGNMVTRWVSKAGTGIVTGSGTLNTIAMFTPNGQAIGDSVITQSYDFINYTVSVDGILEVGETTISDGSIFTALIGVNNITAGNAGNVSLLGGVIIGNEATDILQITSSVSDYTGTASTAAGQVLVSNASSQLEWKSYSESGATFLGWARYDGAASFSNGTEVTVTDGNFTDPVVSLVTNQIIDPYTNGASGKFVFTNDDLNAVYSLTAVFKASAANANQTHVDINFISGATDYERLSKSIGFYKGNNIVDNFHEMFQFYVDSDLITYGLQPRLYAQGGSVKFGDVIFFIQKQQQPAI